MTTTDSQVVLVYLQPESLPGYKTPYQEEHLGLAYIAASLQREGITAHIILSNEDDSIEELVLKILEFNPVVIGFSPTFLTIGLALYCAKKIKELKSDVHITMGGRQATFTAEEILKNENSVDSIIRGEGEITILELVSRVIQKVDLKGCLGVWFRDTQEEVCKSPERPAVENLDSLPFPVRNFDSQSQYQWAQIVTSRGCIHHCSFCTTPSWQELQAFRYGRRTRTAENVIEEIHLLTKKGVTTIEFVDEDFIGTTPRDKERVKKISQLIIKNKLKVYWRALWGAISFHPERDQELLQLLKRSGLEQVGIGLEAGSTPMLKVYHKPTTPQLNKIASQFLIKNNVFPKIGFIMFNPYSTFKELRENAIFLREIGQACYSRYFLKSLEIHHGTQIRERVEKDGLLLEHSYKSDDFQYKFKNLDVEPLALVMRKLLVHPATVRLNNSLYLSDIAVIRSTDQGRSLPNLRFYNATRRKLGQFNTRSFLRWISLAQNGRLTESWDSLMLQYTGVIKEFVDKIELFGYDAYLE